MLPFRGREDDAEHFVGFYAQEAHDVNGTHKHLEENSAVAFSAMMATFYGFVAQDASPSHMCGVSRFSKIKPQQNLRKQDT